MKKLYLVVLSLVILLVPYLAIAATDAVCTQTATEYAAGGSVLIKIACTADSSDGSIPNTDISAENMAKILGTHWLYWVRTYPTSGGTAPEAADVEILMDGQDLLGARGVNLIHATATQDVFPYSSFMSSWRYAPVTNTLTLKVANQTTHSANYTIELYFTR